MGSILGLLGLGGGSGSYGNTNQTGPTTSGAINVNVGGKDITVWVLVGVIGFVGLIAILVFGRRR
jgi:hypothetical protein